MWSKLRYWARRIRRDTLAVYWAMQDRRMPWYAKAVGALVVAYALSPIDLIPDFIPILGYLDDLILVPIGLWIVIRLVPETVMADGRVRADNSVDRPVSRNAAAAIVIIWIGVAVWIGWTLYTQLG